jgi:BirA family biotin operon repressor/biotin-[acetyl-CoA-carboxylase] ligase
MRPAVPLAQAAGLSFVAAVAVGDTIAGFLPRDARIEHKWPNDVLADGAKIAGILLEASGRAGGSAEWVVVGCGVNIGADPGVAGVRTAVLAELAGRDIPVRDVLVALLGNLRRWRGQWESQGFAPVRDGWLARARGLGEAITVRLPREELHGRFEGIDPSGALLLRLSDAKHRAISAGDVYFDQEAERE